MRVLFVGDVFATPGMHAARAFLRAKRDAYDFVIVNGENAAGGFGLTRKHFQTLRNAGADVVTLGNHAFDQADAADLLEETPHLLRPLNYPPGTPGLGAAIHEVPGHGRICVAQVMGRVFMEPLDDPFRALDALIDGLPDDVPLVVDVHAEATSEKKVLGWHLAGRAAAAIGTHTHVATADETLMDGTAYLTDVGMTGVEASSIGMAFEDVHARFRDFRKRRFRPAEGAATVRAVEIDIRGTRARSIRRLRWRADGAHDDGNDGDDQAAPSVAGALGTERAGEGR
ncbi:MAG: TIGR00282 family metallophosphoesterase [Trueperaceae bacterium]